MRQSGIPQFERFKWAVLDRAAAQIEQGMVYGLAREVFPNESEDGINGLVQKAMLELLDDGLIVFYRAGRPEGYNVDLDRVDLLERSEVVMELTRPDLATYVEPPDAMLFFAETPKGDEVFRSLPEGSVWRPHE